MFFFFQPFTFQDSTNVSRVLGQNSACIISLNSSIPTTFTMKVISWEFLGDILIPEAEHVKFTYTFIIYPQQTTQFCRETGHTPIYHGI